MESWRTLQHLILLCKSEPSWIVSILKQRTYFGTPSAGTQKVKPLSYISQTRLLTKCLPCVCHQPTCLLHPIISASPTHQILAWIHLLPFILLSLSHSLALSLFSPLSSIFTPYHLLLSLFWFPFFDERENLGWEGNQNRATKLLTKSFIFLSTMNLWDKNYNTL